MRRPADHRAVAGHEFAGAHEQFVARLDLDRFDVVHLSLHHPVRRARRVGFQRFHRARGPRHRIRIERLAARLHEHYHQSGQRLPQQDGAGDGQHRHHVGRKLTSQHAGKGAPGHRNAGQDQTREPDAVTPGIGVYHERRHGAHDKETESGRW